MKNYLAIYLGTPASMNSWNTLDERTRQEKMMKGFDAWTQWGEKHKNSIVEMGGPLGKTKCTSKKGVSDLVNEMTAYTVVKADSHDAAARMFLEHPHFTIFPGDRVEIMEVMPIPARS